MVRGQIVEGIAVVGFFDPEVEETVIICEVINGLLFCAP
jgi:hypothetical protein